MNIAFAPKFLRMLKKLPSGLQDEVVAKIDLFKNIDNHESLKVHKLKGRLKKFYGFSVDYQNRIIFDYLSENEVVLLAVGDHEVYKMFL